MTKEPPRQAGVAGPGDIDRPPIHRHSSPLLHNLQACAKARWTVPGLALLLFGLNGYVCRELFAIEYTRHMGSIEAAFISLARYISQNWADLTWFPLWYGGIPFQNTYPPLLHATVAAVSTLTPMSPALAYHAVTATLYCLTPVALFWLAWRLSGSAAYSFFAGLMCTALSPSAWLVADIRSDLGTVFGARRFETLVFYGEGPHLMGLVLLPVAIGGLHWVIERRRWWLVPFAAMLLAATVLSNWLAAFALAAAVVSYLISRADYVRSTSVAVVAGLFAYGFAAPWIPPSTIAVIEMNAKTIGGDYTGIYKALPIRAAIVVAVFLLLAWVLRRTNASLVMRFAALFTWLMAAIVLPAAWWDIALLPQPHRYHVEMELGICLLIPFLARPLLARAPENVRLAICVLLLLAAIYPMKRERRYARFQLSAVDVASTVEYKAAKWLDAHAGGVRVMVPGTISYWLNTWTDTPQLGGGFDQGISNFQVRIGHYIVYSDDGAPGRELETSLLWLQAFGVQFVGAGGPGSHEAYKPFRHPDKFRALEEVWREGDDALWRVPQRSRSLARVVPAGSLPSRAPINGIDLDPLRPYVAALDDPALPLADFRWLNRHAAAIESNLRADEAVSFQITHHDGWKARANGVVVPVQKDGLGQMYIEPGCSGPCSIELYYDGGAEMKVAQALQGTAALVSAALLGYGLLSRRRAAAIRPGP